ncbi:GNAT family N-acetyltransferase [Streptosporangium sp. NPDC023615]|uniref:GNAT family N-acetyltransferase n=1 Tax=Streptosporangium sp. NPDC023615 TaxID=3154794 RepID=UPI003421FC30
MPANAVPVELGDVAAVAAACDDDALLLWAAQGMGPRVRAWTLGEAVAVACPDLNRRDRLAVRGPAAQAGALVEYALQRLAPSYRVVGSRDLVEEVVAASPRLRVVGTFEWMDTDRLPPAPRHDRFVAGEGVGWLPATCEQEVGALLAVAAPSSWAVPGLAGVRRWAGLRRPDATATAGAGLVAVAADAWSCPQMGFVAGVATAAAWRGRGHGEAVCRFALTELVAAHGRAALMVDTDNHAAIALYERLGLRRRPLAAAAPAQD